MGELAYSGNMPNLEDTQEFDTLSDLDESEPVRPITAAPAQVYEVDGWPISAESMERLQAIEQEKARGRKRFIAPHVLKSLWAVVSKN